MKKRPFVVCAIATSVDGVIASPYFSSPLGMEAVDIFLSARQEYGCDMSFMGAGSAVNLWTGPFLDPNELPPAEQTFPREDFIAVPGEKDYYPILNARGNLSYSGEFIQKRGKGKIYRPIEVMIETVSDAYIQYLRSHNISYLFAGRDQFDPELCVRKLGQLFGADRILISGGGLIDYTFLKAGLVDEYCQVIFPFTDGATGVASAFDRSPSDTAGPFIVDLDLLEAKPLEKNCVLLRYRPKNIRE